MVKAKPPAVMQLVAAPRVVVGSLGRVKALGGDPDRGDLVAVGAGAGEPVIVWADADEFGFSTPTGLVASPGSLASQHMDLATVIAHEMGLALGLKETTQPGDIMGPFLPTGERRLPTPYDIDALFAELASSQHSGRHANIL
jgi:hypothetical protein